MSQLSSSGSETGPPAAPSALQAPGGLGMLMDMEMPVVIRFGTTRMLVRDLLALGSGSVIEFRRVPDDPVDVVVNGRVVARGTVVLVQGNYGVRITEIASPQQAVPASSGPTARPVKDNHEL